ncbi:AmmeMemoRadiSam system radical SAM enzyme [Clostridium tarantellae]|uniref:AmmeMemoRadiSam system radical SAM enzyme n=1 Tax=Clostridium tarantellae TaxID=39493 RepID=A0A6I1MRR3_9CLOT|nr:AmmeMemoRadiSam system radical SAM enzyme [Clostridium tarantellae]MPQ44882.1 AmmeMemoRadiSam system radical SAM enzyme [Clostridium tarantellae]
MNKEALFYKKEGNNIRCELCPHNCLISEGRTGICNVREVKKDYEGNLKLYTLNYGEITSMSLDPIEKKPLYNFYPGSYILSIGSFGCNFKCTFCQNFSISQYRAKSQYISAKDMCDTSLNLKNNMGLAFTYNEPTIWYEYVLDVSRMIKNLNKNHKIVLVTNGYINEEPLKRLLPYVDALNIDLKGNNKYYKDICFGTLNEVKNTIKISKEMGCHIEITTLLVPKFNTDDETINHIGKFLKSIDEDIPIHLSRYFPRYKMNEELTSLEQMKKSYRILKKYLKNVYLGNLTVEELKICTE